MFVINDSPAEAQIAVGSGDVDGRHFLGDHILDLFIYFFKKSRNNWLSYIYQEGSYRVQPGNGKRSVPSRRTCLGDSSDVADILIDHTHVTWRPNVIKRMVYLTGNRDRRRGKRTCAGHLQRPDPFESFGAGWGSHFWILRCRTCPPWRRWKKEKAVKNEIVAIMLNETSVIDGT